MRAHHWNHGLHNRDDGGEDQGEMAKLDKHGATLQWLLRAANRLRADVAAP
jgi:hypothetical protein